MTRKYFDGELCAMNGWMRFDRGDYEVGCGTHAEIYCVGLTDVRDRITKKVRDQLLAKPYESGLLP